MIKLLINWLPSVSQLLIDANIERQVAFEKVQRHFQAYTKVAPFFRTDQVIVLPFTVFSQEAIRRSHLKQFNSAEQDYYQLVFRMDFIERLFYGKEEGKRLTRVTGMRYSIDQDTKEERREHQVR